MPLDPQVERYLARQAAVAGPAPVTSEDRRSQRRRENVMTVEDRGRNSRPRLTDLRGVADSSIGYSEVASIAERVGGRPLSTAIRSAFLVDQPVQLGFARMFQTLNKHPQVTVGIFEDESAARRWLLDSSGDQVGG